MTAPPDHPPGSGGAASGAGFGGVVGLRRRRRPGHRDHSLVPLRVRPPPLRLDAFPFAVAYGAIIYLDLRARRRPERDGGGGDAEGAPRGGWWGGARPESVPTALLALALLAHVGLFLATRWRTDVRARVGYVRCRPRPDPAAGGVESESGAPPPGEAAERAMRTWTHALVAPLGPNAGSAEIVPISLRRTGGGDLVAVADFHGTVFRCASSGGTSDGDDEMDGIWGASAEGGGGDAATDGGGGADGVGGGGDGVPPAGSGGGPFHRLHFPVDLPLPFYATWSGHDSTSSLRRAASVYGVNAHPIVLPPFLRLLSEQLIAPFFLFQLFCVMLWSLDEYWYYAIFTLCTLVMFECTVAFNRLKSLQRLRETLRPPFKLWAYRARRWECIRSDELVAGDVISLTAKSDAPGLLRMAGTADPHDHEGGRHVPADCLLVRGGTAVADEAALTGESVPQMKEPVDSVAGASGGGGGGARLDVDDPSHRRSVLFGGTLLVDHCPAQDDEDGGGGGGGRSKEGVESIPSPPDRGLTALVLRTGFDTTQGSLLRTMVHTSVRGNKGSSHGGADGFDTLVFICILLLCALVASSVVLRHGWYDPTRNRFKLVLHVVIIVTSVVPPELPMELSLAVTSSLSDLVRRCNVYCTEPFRIPLAGMVDTCCFDKTGTITSDEMILRGIRLPPPLAAGKTGGGTRIECADGTECGGNDDLALPRGGEGGGADIAEDDGGGETSERGGDTIPREAMRVMAACHSLAATSVDDSDRRTGIGGGGGGALDGVVGDPLEKAVLRACRWTVLGNGTVAPEPSAADPTAAARAAPPIKIYHRFAFASKLKRMTALASDLPARGAAEPPEVWALTKGAPETVKRYLAPGTVPLNYDAVYRRHMGLGQRVLALAHRSLGPAKGYTAREVRDEIKDATKGRWSRSEVEKDLTFAGFLVLDCPLKSDSRKVMKELKGSGHECIMITGDAVLTAAEVARMVGIVDSGTTAKSKKGKDKKGKDKGRGGPGGGPETYELREMRGYERSSSSFHHVDFDAEQEWQQGSNTLAFAFIPLTTDAASDMAVKPEKCIAYVPSNLTVVEDMLRRKEIAGVCVSGDVLTKIAVEAVKKSHQEKAKDGGKSQPPPHIDDKSVLLHPAAQSELRRLAPIVSVFARHAPRQKEAVIAALNAAGRTTLMCGDGTNDVGALKMAHVGISIVSVPDLEAKHREAMDEVQKLQLEEWKDRKRSKKGKKSPKDKGVDGSPGKAKKPKSRKKSLEKHLRAMAEAEEELEFVALGDASVASPFTSKTMSVKCACDVLQRGRCTLVTMLQIYKILGVNCLVNALVLTRLHMAGAKQGDRQLTVVGLVVAALFLFVTRGKPLRSLSPHRPPASVLCVQTLLSIAAQFAVHLVAISIVTALSAAFMDPWDPSLVPDGPFNANVLNTSTFLMTVLATINTFAVNYQGRPFMEDLSENAVLLRTVQACYVALFACAAEVFPPLNDLLQLSTLPSGSVEDWMVGGGDTNALSGTILSEIVGMMGFKATLCCLMIADSVAAYGVERAIARYFDAS